MDKVIHLYVCRSIGLCILSYFLYIKNKVNASRAVGYRPRSQHMRNQNLYLCSKYVLPHGTFVSLRLGFPPFKNSHALQVQRVFVLFQDSAGSSLWPGRVGGLVVVVGWGMQRGGGGGGWGCIFCL